MNLRRKEKAVRAEYVCIMLPHVPRMSVRSTWFAVSAVWLVSMLLAIPAAMYSKAASYIWKGGTFCVQAWPIKHQTRSLPDARPSFAGHSAGTLQLPHLDVISTRYPVGPHRGHYKTPSEQLTGSYRRPANEGDNCDQDSRCPSDVRARPGLHPRRAPVQL
ncbi:PROKR2 [Branchiostoma lanceolatum]|uniref:PROKR2 protein n=1 Tax=Branchiostoma lanceolatum TaxID=7740 RepID=A0A8K0A066_BRALA|nr:PROKR2 [Branchiostoma lanceolatum]